MAIDEIAGFGERANRRVHLSERKRELGLLPLDKATHEAVGGNPTHQNASEAVRDAVRGLQQR